MYIYIYIHTHTQTHTRTHIAYVVADAAAKAFGQHGARGVEGEARRDVGAACPAHVRASHEREAEHTHACGKDSDLERER